MKVSAQVDDLYATYYADQSVAQKRAIAARQTVDHLLSMLDPGPVASLIDIGAGEGAVLAELHLRGIAQEYSAVEISDSGLQSIHRRALPRLVSATKFDGYHIGAEDRRYALGVAAHVLEHVEHERSFLAEACRVCELLYVEVPLELTISVRRAIAAGPRFGHINFYTPESFRNLLDTSCLEVLRFRVFANSLGYERHVSGRRAGTVKYHLRTSLLRAAPAVAPWLMTYLAGALCRRR